MKKYMSADETILICKAVGDKIKDAAVQVFKNTDDPEVFREILENEVNRVLDEELMKELKI